MREWLSKLVKRGMGGTRVSSAPDVAARRFQTVSRPEYGAAFEGMDAFLPLPNETPFEMLRVYRYLRDAVPDVSDAVWTWKRLCQTGYDVDILDASSDGAKTRAAQAVRDLDRRINHGGGGMDGLLDILYTSLFTYGAAALEIVLSRDRDRIHDVVPVDVWTVRFRRENGVPRPYQVFDGEETPLPPERFVYLALDRDGTNPYGRSMLRSIPFVTKIQQRLIEDMAKATHNAGWARLHVRYSPGDASRAETPEARKARIESGLAALRDGLDGLKTDQNLVTTDNVEVRVVQGGQNERVFYDNQKAIEEQVITGMHLMPILLGRNYGTTETYGTAQYEIINRQVEAVNRGVKRLLERLYAFELAFIWGSARARVTMRHNRTVDALRDAQARAQVIANAIQLRDEGFMGRDEAIRLLGIGT